LSGSGIRDPGSGVGGPVTDSCVARGRKFDGVDPITNYMDYVDDVCMTDFTLDQAARMDKQWKVFRQ
jgi:hypothetical protein